MIEYTWDDIIINPNTERVRGAIGKECYFDDNPSNVLGRANYDDTVNILPLKEIEPNSSHPFIFDGVEGPVAFSCIIIKKEEPKPKHRSKYIPYQITTRNLAEYWEKLKGRAFIIDDEECTLIETVTSIYKDFDEKEADINKYKVSLLRDDARWLDTGEPVGEEIENE